MADKSEKEREKRDGADEVEVPDQQEDPEAYVQHVQDVREQDAEMAEQEAEIARQRGNLPPELSEEEITAQQKAEEESAAALEAERQKEAEEAQAQA